MLTSLWDFNRNITYSSVDLLQLLLHSELAGSLIKEVFSMFRDGVVGLIKPIKTYALSEIESALNSM